MVHLPQTGESTHAHAPSGPTHVSHTLSPAELQAVAELWTRTRREVAARFTGRSMEPTIPSGAEVRLQCGGEAAVGDVLAFVRDGHLVLHRVEGLSATDGWVLTRGDAFVWPDPPLMPGERRLGRVVAVDRGDGFAPPGPAPSGSARGLARRACLVALRRSPVLGGALIRALRLLRPAVWTRSGAGRATVQAAGD
jgi:hypothetical protein